VTDVLGADELAALAEVHDDLRAVARDLLAPTGPLVSGGDPVAADWDLLARSGWLGLEVPEALGGGGASFAEVAVVLEELGRVASPSPFLGTVVLGVGALLGAAPGDERDRLLAGVADGSLRVAGVVAGGTEPATSAVPFAVESSPGRTSLRGTAAFVPDAADADHLLVVAHDPSSGPVVVAVDAGTDGLEVTSTPVVDASRSVATVTAVDVEVDPARCWTLDGDPRRIGQRGALAVAIDGLGLAEAALEATVAYASVREQFDRPIGSFQAVKHACADVAVDIALARQLVRRAVLLLATVADGDDVAVAIAMAAAHAGDAAVRATGTAVQLHGGIGYTWEHGVHVLLKRATFDRSLFGSPRAHRAFLAERYASGTLARDPLA
jgi:alkylation response protein AidB-like acyl-CoA dehydrogenase